MSSGTAKAGLVALLALSLALVGAALGKPAVPPPGSRPGVAARLPAWVTVFLLIAFEAAMMALTGDSFVLRAIDRAAAMPSIRHWFPLG